MPAYVISDVEFLDPDLVAAYREIAAETIALYGGRYIVRGGAPANVEGDWHPQNIVIVEFPTMERAREWYDSPEYARTLAIRDGALKRDVIFVEGAGSA